MSNIGSEAPAHPVCFICRKKILEKSALRGFEEVGKAKLFHHYNCAGPLQLWEIFWRYNEARQETEFMAAQFGVTV